MRTWLEIRDPDTGKLVRIPEIRGGMPTGTGAVNLRNLPNVAYEVNPAKFFALTERNVFEPQAFGIAAPANSTIQTLLQVGVVSQLRLIVKGTAQMTVPAGSSGTATPTFKWPYGIFSTVQVSGNGMNNFINCPSNVLFYRQVAQNRAFLDSYTTVAGLFTGVTNAASSTTNYVFQIQLVIPIAMDDASLIGSLYAQSEATNLTYTLFTESIANLFVFTGQAGTAIAFLNNTQTVGSVPQCFVMETFFEVPYDPQKGDTLVIPDLTVLHGIIANYNPVAGLGTVTTPLYRVNGQLERLFFYMDNNNALVALASWAATYLLYGGNQTPYSYNPQDFLQVKNMEDYRFGPGAFAASATSLQGAGLPAGVFCIDLVAENPVRDQVLLEGVTNLRLQTSTVAAFTPNVAARIAFIQETLFA